eukprot:5366706-Pleurochrysis_carterae.AAC.1
MELHTRVDCAESGHPVRIRKVCCLYNQDAEGSMCGAVRALNQKHQQQYAVWHLERRHLRCTAKASVARTVAMGDSSAPVTISLSAPGVGSSQIERSSCANNERKLNLVLKFA